MSQPIWLNNKTKRDGRTVKLSHWIRNGIFFINDLFTENGNFLSLEHLRNMYQVNVNFVEYYSLIDAIPLDWRRLIRNQKKLQNIVHPLVKLLKNSIKTTKPFYLLLLKKCCL